MSSFATSLLICPLPGFAGLLLSFSLAACAQLSFLTPKAGALPAVTTTAVPAQDGDFTSSARVQESIGEMTPVRLKLRNNTEIPRLILLKRIVAISSDNKVTAPLEANVAAAQIDPAGQSSNWNAILRRAGVGTLAGGLAGAGTGAIFGLVVGLPFSPIGAGIGAAVGAGAGASIGAIAGAVSGAIEAYRHRPPAPTISMTPIIERQITDQLLLPGMESDGFIFLPKADYTHVKLTLAAQSDGEVELTVPVSSASASDS